MKADYDPIQVRVQKVHEAAKMPKRAYGSDAGMDLFYCPKPHEGTGVEPVEVIAGHSSIVLPTGLKIEVPQGYMLEIKNKSGIASKRGLLVGACVVDAGYEGEVFVNLHNVRQSSQIIKAGDKVAQGVFVKIPTHVALVESDHIYDEPTKRGDGALGSTGDR